MSVEPLHRGVGEILQNDAENLKADDQHQRRKVDRPGIGHDPPDRLENRVEQSIDRPPDGGDEIVVHVHHVEGIKPGKHRTGDDDPDIEIIYQLPIYFMVEEHEEGTEFEAKGLLDGVYIDHKKKTITPLDLKTIGKPISQFKQSYLKYGYYLQAEWYMYALEELIKFKNWKSIGEVVIPEKTFVGDKTHELNKKFSSLSDYRVNPFNFIVSETKPFYQNPAQIFKVPAEQRKFAWRGGTHNGRYYEGLNELLITYKWHLETNYWDMPKELYLNQGITTLNLLT